MTYLVDTDILIDFFKHKDPAKGLIAKLSEDATLALSTLTITELRSGWTSKEADFLLPRLYALCAVVPVTKEIAQQAGMWRQEYKRKGVSLGTPDTVIAATAYVNTYPLPTFAATHRNFHQRPHRYTRSKPVTTGLKYASLGKSQYARKQAIAQKTNAFWNAPQSGSVPKLQTCTCPRCQAVHIHNTRDPVHSCSCGLVLHRQKQPTLTRERKGAGWGL